MKIINKYRRSKDRATSRSNYYLLVGLLILSLFANVIIILPYASSIFHKVEQKLFPTPCFTTVTPDFEVLDKVCQATIELNGEKMASSEMRGIPEDLYTFYGLRKPTDIVCSYPLAYGLVGASYYAVSRNDSSSMEKLKKRVQKYIDKGRRELTYDIDRKSVV